MRRLWQRIFDWMLRHLRPGRCGSMPSAPALVSGCTYRAVTGPAGSGKTTAMIAEAEEAMKCGLRVMAIVSSEHVAKRLTSLPCYDPSRHFAGTPRALCCRLIPDRLLVADEDIIGIALGHIDDASNKALSFSRIFVDEAQNVSPTLIRLIDRLTDTDGHATTYFLDPAQAIFSFAGATSDTIALIRARVGNRLVRLQLRHRPAPVILPLSVAADRDEAVTMAVDTAIRLSSRGESCAILTRTNSEAAQAYRLLEQRGITPVLLSARLLAADNPEPDSDMQRWRYYAMRRADITDTPRQGITVATAHTARDREFHHVVVLATAVMRPTDDMAAEHRRLSTARNRASRSAVTIEISRGS